jgi:glycosyltransferase involved in cell wall biosynthesis
MRIVYLNPVGFVGGAERGLLSAIASLRRAEPEIEAHLIACTDGPLLAEARRLGLRARVVAMPGSLVRTGDSGQRAASRLGKAWGLLRQGVAALPAAWAFARRLGDTLRALAPDVIHSNGIKTHLLTRLAGVKHTPIVWHVQDFYSTRPAVGRLLRWAGKGVDAAIAISGAVARDVQGLLPGVPASVVYHAVDVHQFAPGRADAGLLDRLAGLPPAPAGLVRIGLVATYARWKGQNLFLQASARLRGQLQVPTRFYIIGGPIYQTQGSQFSEAELRALAGRLNLTGDVGFIPFQPSPGDIYRALDVVVHGSTQPEPFGLTIVEAMACSRPVIISQAGGAAELFTHGHDALGYPPGDADALAAAVRQVAVNADERRRLGENARRSAVRRFSQDRLGPEILAVYHSVVRQRGRGSGRSAQVSENGIGEKRDYQAAYSNGL